MKSKKKILFVIPSLDAGGAEKALVNLLSVLPVEQFDIDIMLFSKQGIFLQQLPAGINVMTPDGKYALFTQSLGASLKSLLLSGSFSLLYKRLRYYFCLRKNNNGAVAEQMAWKYWSSAIPNLSTSYDVAIAFLEKSSVYYVVDKVTAVNKIAWIHTTYDKSGLDATLDEPYFNKLQHLVTITEECKSNLLSCFKQLPPISIIQNVSSKRLIYNLAQQTLDTTYNVPLIVTVGRLSEEKGIDMAIDAAIILKSHHIKFHWVFVGDGSFRSSLEQKISEFQLASFVTLVGNQANPYKYIYQATIYCQPSRYEGKSIAIDEAKLLGKPIVVTNFDTVKDQIISMYNGFIVEQSAESIANGVIELLQNEKLRATLQHNLSTFEINEQEILDQFLNITAR